MDTAKIVYHAKKNGLSIDGLAKSIGINGSSLHRKINGKTEFKRSEIKAIQNILNINNEEVIEIFF